MALVIVKGWLGAWAPDWFWHCPATGFSRYARKCAKYMPGPSGAVMVKTSVNAWLEGVKGPSWSGVSAQFSVPAVGGVAEVENDHPVARQLELLALVPSNVTLTLAEIEAPGVTANGAPPGVHPLVEHEIVIELCVRLTSLTTRASVNVICALERESVANR